MSQTLVLTAPIVPVAPPSTTTYTVALITLQRLPFAYVSIAVVDNNGNRTEVVYSDHLGGTVATALLSALNTANLSTKSLQQRVLERLVADGKLPAGAVTGVPD